MKNNQNKIKSIAITIMALSSYPVTAQENNEQPIEEVIVTATKTGAKSLQDVAIAISAFGAHTLEQSGVYGASELATLVPNLEVTSVSQYSIISIRGIGTNNAFSGGDPSTTTHIDGVYIARPSAQMYDFLDIERIEVLRGPQGTLYGRNSNAGTINVISREPNDEQANSIKAGVGNKGRRLINLSTNIPVIADRLAFNITGRYKEHGNFIENINQDGPQKVWFDKYYALRSKLKYTPNENLKHILAIDYLNEEGSPISFYSRPKTPNHPIGDNGLESLDGYTVQNQHTTAVNETNTLDVTSWGTSLTTEIKLDAFSIKNIAAYRSSKNISNFDLDASGLEMLHTNNFVEDQWQFSEDFQITGAWDKGEWIVGAYYLHEVSNTYFNIEIHPIISGTYLLQTQGIDATTKSTAIYAQGRLSLTQKASATAGMRYTKDSKKANNFGGFEAFPSGFPTDVTQQVSGAGRFEAQDSKTFTAWTPKLSFEYNISDNIMSYISTTRGFKSGGYNLLVQSVPISYDPETVWSYEAGLKTSYWDNKVITNLTAFKYNYNGYQVLQFGSAGSEFVSNVKAAKISGLEVETAIKLSSNLQIGGTLSLLNTAYNDPNFEVTNNLTATRVNAHGNRLSNAPEITWTAFANLSHRVGLGTLNSHFEVAHKGSVYFSPSNNVAEASNAYTLVNASVELISQDGLWEVSFLAKNITDKTYYSAAASFIMPVAIPNPPRTLMGFVRLNF